jgi:hypothetical protein
MARDVLQGPALTQENLNEIAAITRKWTRDKKKFLVANLSRLGLVKTGEIMKSVRAGVRTRQGEAHTIWFKYKYYGLFHDKGAENAGRNHIDLPAKHWMAQHIYGPNLDDLLESLADYYQEVAINSIKLTDVKA